MLNRRRDLVFRDSALVCHSRDFMLDTSVSDSLHGCYDSSRLSGGDLQFVSIPGFGMDVFLMTKKLDREARSETTDLEHLERLEYKAAEINRFTG